MSSTQLPEAAALSGRMVAPRSLAKLTRPPRARPPESRTSVSYLQVPAEVVIKKRVAVGRRGMKQDTPLCRPPKGFLQRGGTRVS